MAKRGKSKIAKAAGILYKKKIGNISPPAGTWRCAIAGD